MKILKDNHSIEVGRLSELQEFQEVQDLKPGMDFRLPQYRREVFLRFYEFHTKYRIHPGLVYLYFPELASRLSWTTEQKLWFAFINGATQNPCTTYAVFQAFPDFQAIDVNEFEAWHRDNWKRMDFDNDRRYIKGHLSEMLQDYRGHLKGLTQEEFFSRLCVGNPWENFRSIWDYIIKNFNRYGRLSTFSYLEYLKIMGVRLECDSLFLSDVNGSKSHRNGLCKVLGRDDLDWHDENPRFPGYYTEEIIDFLEAEGEELLFEAGERADGQPWEKDVSYFTLESTFCPFKGWFRKNRRYPNVYTDMSYNRIKKAEALWQGEVDFQIFWDIRKACLPEYLLLECSPDDPGLVPEKQNWFRETGQVLMMDRDWPCFENDFHLRKKKAGDSRPTLF